MSERLWIAGSSPAMTWFYDVFLFHLAALGRLMA
jgi:hypothetical protein